MTISRSYEISIWTLQDEFLSVLKPSDIENKGFVQSPVVTFKSDSVDTCTFSIPKFLYLDDQHILNPIWGNITKGNFTKNLHKIKVIFNKGTEDQEIAEFIILDVKEKHENDQIFTEVSCEGLAFHELGKRGYKVSLSADDYYNDYNAWFDSASEGEPPHNTLQYWTEKFMQPVPENDTLTDVNTWYYEVDMDWSSYAGAGRRDANKVYEEAYTASWEYNDINAKLQPTRIEEAKEKERLVDIEKSNIYNITQKIAEIFGVFCKYKYLYDKDFHITGRRVIYYNNYAREKEGYLDLTYPYTTSSVEREYEGKDITTKMFVESVQSDAGNTISIMDNNANKSQEDYLLNFEYLKQIGELSQEQIKGIEDYETEMHQLNIEIKSLQNTVRNLTQIQNDLQSQVPLLQNSINGDQERIEESDDYFNNLIEKSGNADGTISINGNNFDRLVMLEDSKMPGTYYITLTREGILVETVHIYYNIDYTNPDTKLKDEISGWVPEYDNYNNLYRISGLRKPQGDNIETSQNRVYLIYDYSPKLYHELVKNTYLSKLAQDQNDFDLVNEKLQTIEEKLEAVQAQLDAALEGKNKKVQDFETLMGPALRESYWRPEDYNDYGNMYLDVLNPSTSTSGASGYTTFIWDNILFDEEQKSYYEFGVEREKKYYPCINLKPYLEKLDGHWDELNFLFYDFYKADDVEAPSRLKSLAIDSQAQYGFIEDGNHNVIPVLILTGIEGMTQSSLNRLITAAPRLGKMQVTVTNTFPTSEELENITTTVDTWVLLTAADFINATQDASENYSFNEVTLLYPRIKIDSFKLKDADQEGVKLKFDEQVLMNYEDFYILTRDIDLDTVTEEAIDSQDYDIDPFYCVTIKPVTMIKYGIDKTLEPQEEESTEIPLVTSISYKDIILNFILSNASIAIYLDAMQVLKENAFPRISYTITPSVFDPSFMYTAYNKLHRIVNINDIDLHLVNIQGYISQVELNLDNPWEDKYEIKNYRNKFEDLFTSIVAQTEAMQRNEFTMTLAANVLTPEGLIYENVLQNTFRRVDFDYAFNNGALTINEEDGIWGTSDTGVVAYRGGGIFTATKKDDDGNWLWNTGITPEGINADLITTGQLDTNRINIYAGDNIRFQMNGDGLYAYKPILEDEKLIKLAQEGDEIAENFLQNAANFDFSTKQYVVHNPNGLFLTAEVGTIVATPKNITEESGTNNDSETEYEAKVLAKAVDRVEISWDGLVLRNWDGEEVLSADPDTGDLSLTGFITAQGLKSEGNITISPGDKLIIDGETFINGPLTISANGRDVIRETMSDVTQYYGQIKEVVIIDDAGVHVTPTNNSGYSTLTDSQGFHIYQDNTPIASFAAKGTFVNRLQVGNIVVKESNTHGWSWVPAK